MPLIVTFCVSGRRDDAGRITTAAPSCRLPVFIHAGAVLPLDPAALLPSYPSFGKRFCRSMHSRMICSREASRALADGANAGATMKCRA
jgi:hypothetical protein